MLEFVGIRLGFIIKRRIEYLFRRLRGTPSPPNAEEDKFVGLDRGVEAFQEAFNLFPAGKVPHNFRGTDYSNTRQPTNQFAKKL